MPNYYPIIYVRGYAMFNNEMDETVATPYMGFNIGSTKIRQSWDKTIIRYVFESPLVRLMKDHEYLDIYSRGKEIYDNLPKKPLIIYRYYEKEWEEVDDNGDITIRPAIKSASTGLSELIDNLRGKYCKKYKMDPGKFKVYLVAHSMGGLICRCLLQNKNVDTYDSGKCVDKVFTYATPHNGIEIAGFNVPGFWGWKDLNNFNRKKIIEYLNIGNGNANSLDGKFPEEQFFCLVGTNSKDYEVAKGASRMLTGNFGDGLVLIKNACVKKAPRAHVHRSHSGHFGIVNSEEGYQNLTRFLFGDVKVSGKLIVNNLPLPSKVQTAKEHGKQIRASYYFETRVSPRGGINYYLDQRLCSQESAILRGYDELMKDSNKRDPHLFSVFLDSTKTPPMDFERTGVASPDEERDPDIVFVVDLEVKATEYEINNVLFLDTHLPGERIFKNQIVFFIKRVSHGIFNLNYKWNDDYCGSKQNEKTNYSEDNWVIDVKSEKGFQAQLKITIDDLRGEHGVRSVRGKPSGPESIIVYGAQGTV